MMRLDSLMSTSNWPLTNTFVTGMYIGTVLANVMGIKKDGTHLFQNRDLSLQ